MNTGIAAYIIDLIDSQPWIDKIGGIVTAVTTKENGITKTIPAACGTQHRDCVSDKLNDLVPNSRYLSVVFFEDGGVTFGKVVKDRQQFTSRLRMVVWLNLQKLGETGCSLASDIIIEILRLIPAFPQNYGNYLQLLISPTSQPIRSKDIFSKYTFDETVNQYLMTPYDYFAIDINASWWMNVDCIRPYSPESPIDCPTQPV